MRAGRKGGLEKIVETGEKGVVFTVFLIIWLCGYCVPRPLTQSRRGRG